MFELIIQTDFAAAHRLRGYKGACEKLHGHNWKLDVVLQSDRLNELGMVVDFQEVKVALKDILAEFDHSFLNDLARFKTVNPTTENIAKAVAQELAKRLPRGVRVKSVTSWESDRCGATYTCASPRRPRRERRTRR